jgi:hypothetical protein
MKVTHQRRPPLPDPRDDLVLETAVNGREFEDR